MKKLILLTMCLMLNTGVSFASDNTLYPESWKTATVSDIKRKLQNGAYVNVGNNNSAVVQVVVVAGANVNMENNGLTMMDLLELAPEPGSFEEIPEERTSRYGSDPVWGDSSYNAIEKNYLGNN